MARPEMDAPGTAEGFAGQAQETNETEHPNSAAPLHNAQTDKIKAGVFASAALVGLEVYELADGSFICSRWGFIKPAADLAGVMRMVRQMGGAA